MGLDPCPRFRCKEGNDTVDIMLRKSSISSIHECDKYIKLSMYSPNNNSPSVICEEVTKFNLKMDSKGVHNGVGNLEAVI
jgi:hypothetical protein